MAAGIVGVNKSQIEDLEKIVARLSQNGFLFNALAKSFIFQDLGRLPFLREKYRKHINPSSFAEAGAIFLEKEKIADKYQLADKENALPYIPGPAP